MGKGTRFQGGTLFHAASSICKGYLGSKERVADMVLERVPRGALFIEAFCGGASLSYIMKKHGRRVLCGDLSYYAYLHGAGLIAQSTHRPELSTANKATLLKTLERIKPARGYATELGKTKKLPFDAGWADGYCLKHSSDPVMLLALGKVMDKCRAAGCFPTWTNQVIPHARFMDSVVEHLNLIDYSIIPEETARAEWGSASVLVQNNYMTDGYLYLDPAWPFTDGSDAGSFYKFPAQVGAILQQTESVIDFMDEPTHTRFILDIVRNFKDRGGRRALVATQSTNSPAPEVVAQLLEELGPVERATRRVEGGTHKTGFTEYLMTVDLQQ